MRDFKDDLQAALLGSNEEEPFVWAEPVPPMALRKLPPFPTACLPPWQRDFVAALAEATQTPEDLAGVIVLCCTAAAAGGRAVVDVNGRFREPTNLYGVVAMPPGSRKSAVFAACVEPLHRVERTMAHAIGADIAAAMTQKDIAHELAKQAKTRAAKADETERDKLEAEAIAAAQMAEAITVPTKPRLTADDATVEAISSLLAEHGGRLAIFSPEGIVFETMAGRYKDGPSFTVFLQAHAGDPLRVDRIGRPPAFVERPALTICATVQPAVVESISRHKEFRGRGLLARNLWSLPESNIGSRRINTEPVSDEVREAYSDNLGALVLSLAEWTDPAVLPLTPQAHDLFVALETELEPRLGRAGDLAVIADWAGKYAGAVVRIAGLLHLGGNLRTGWATPIDESTMSDAIRLGEYFLEHARAALDLMGADQTRILADIVLRWLPGHRTVSKRDVYIAHRTRLPKAADVDPVLELLEDLGWLRQLPPPPPKKPTGGRPPSPTFETHPDLAK